GMTKNQRFDKPILTPTTKSDKHDESISAKEIVGRGIVDAKTWKKLEQIVFGLFSRGTDIAGQNGLILVDTKYELGKDDKGNILLIDEIHTPDSSRYWLADSYKQRIQDGQEPENIDKEFLRLWFKEHCNPYKDAVLPAAPKELVVELSHRYIRLYEMITGMDFEVDVSTPIKQRLTRNIMKYLSK
ncbi:MAG TPA: phosphoribosylaminoimidazolesuccinocarboxamide synthase, partial [Chitinivibrionales bacterium]|nr:phosphoribosylaminoimidazolesuccinocarboxamide synthase [Chitinivibrionales bacterium]